MDIAYDQIQEEALSPHEPNAPNPFSEDTSKAEGSKSSDAPTQPQRPLSSDLNTEFKEAYQTIASTAWGAKLGGLWGTVRKQVCWFGDEAGCGDVPGTWELAVLLRRALTDVNINRESHTTQAPPKSCPQQVAKHPKHPHPPLPT